MYPEERDVLFPAGTQFQGQRGATEGLKQLLEAAMRCSLVDVDVDEVRGPGQTGGWRGLERCVGPVRSPEWLQPTDNPKAWLCGGGPPWSSASRRVHCSRSSPTDIGWPSTAVGQAPTAVGGV